MEARYEPVDLAAFTADLASVFRSAIDRAGLAFEVDCPPLPEPVYVDREMWEKVVLNLLSQRAEIHLRRRDQRDAAGRRTPARCCGRRHRDRDRRGRAAAAVRALPPDPLHPLPVQRGQRHRPGAGPELVGLHGGSITAGQHRRARAPPSPSGSRSATAHLPDERPRPRPARKRSPRGRSLPRRRPAVAARRSPGRPPLAAPCPTPVRRRWPGRARCARPGAARRRQRGYARVPATAAARAATRSPRWRTARRRWTRPGRIRPTW